MIDLNLLYEHQKDAVQKSIDSNFLSGTHFHATGTGKSWISLYILAAFLNNKIYLEKSNKTLIIFWICERKNILKDQFGAKFKEYNIYNFIKKHVNILNTIDKRYGKWYDSVNSSIFWKKPLLIIINRAYLTSQENYKKIKLPVNLVLHDECHTIINNSSQEFYKWLHKKNEDVSCIGFTATPFYSDKIDINPFKNIISKFTIYNACIQSDVILKPKIERYEIEENNKSSTLTDEEIAYIIMNRISSQPYKKIIVWAGIIEHCFKIAKIWKNIFRNFSICIDTSVDNNTLDTITYDDFYNLESNAIMFCACKHREGSDIPNLDTCVFLDYVEDRGHLNFIQCVGRVLRKDNLHKKKYGLIIDIKARSTIKLCDRLSEAFQLPLNVFPWVIKNEEIHINTKKIKIHILEISNFKPKVIDNYTDISRDDLVAKFKRNIPKSKKYTKRIDYELDIIISKKLGKYLMQALDILHITDNINSNIIPHITRGSCGSSLVCYILGISHVDPVKYNISFARFLNECRDNLPDIDFDFPYNTRDAIFIELQNKWPGKIARISNHVHYHEKSAKREALRRAGVKGFISKGDLYNIERNLDKDTRKMVNEETNRLLDTFKCYSLHCGGIVYYEEGVPINLLMKDNKDNIKFNTIQQIVSDKRDIGKEKRFKIDILSSRGLAQLNEIYRNVYPNKLLSFDNTKHIGDLKTCIMLKQGDNIGITLAESPLMRKTFIKLEPNSLYSMAVCLSIIRPAASEAKQAEAITEADKYLIFDDDAINLIQYATKCNEAIADKIRRNLSKKDLSSRLKGTSLLKELYRSNKDPNKISLNDVFKKLKGLQKYSFCKSHAYSYAQLVWYLAYMKANYPIQFWKSTLNHSSSHYKSWVHKYEAARAGVDWSDTNLSVNEKSVYSKARNKKINLMLTDKIEDIEQLKKTGIWNFSAKNPKFINNCYGYTKNNKYIFRGIIASVRVYKNYNFNIYLCVGPGKYIEIHYSKNIRVSLSKDKVGLSGYGYIKNTNPLIIKCEVNNSVKSF